MQHLYQLHVSNSFMSSDSNARRWQNPAAVALPKEGYIEKHDGRYGPIFPQTPGLTFMKMSELKLRFRAKSHES